MAVSSSTRRPISPMARRSLSFPLIGGTITTMRAAGGSRSRSHDPRLTCRRDAFSPQSSFLVVCVPGHEGSRLERALHRHCFRTRRCDRRVVECQQANGAVVVPRRVVDRDRTSIAVSRYGRTVRLTHDTRPAESALAQLPVPYLLYGPPNPARGSRACSVACRSRRGSRAPLSSCQSSVSRRPGRSSASERKSGTR